MSGFLLDTNVLSELGKPRPSRPVVQFVSRIPLEDLLTTEITLAETRFGIELTADVVRREYLSNWLDNVIRPMFAGRVVPVTEDALLRWRVLIEQVRRRRFSIPEPDLLIVALALLHGHTVLTRDIKPFSLMDVPCIDPWKAS